MPTPNSREPAPSRAAVREHLAAALGTAHPARLLRVTLPAPPAAPTALLRAFPASFACSWQPAVGYSMAGLGTAREIEVEGGERLSRLRREIQGFAEVESYGFPGLDVPAPRLFGGLSFAAGAEHGPLWRPFGDGRFVLPRWSYGRQPGGAFLGLVLAGGGPGREEALRQLDAIWEALEAPPARPEWPPARELRVRHLDPKIWNRRVKEIREKIRGSETLQKVVTARTTRVEPAGAFDALEVFERLAELYPGCNLFFFRRDGAAFLGASPEILFAKHGRELTTQGLAGSVRIHPDLSAAEAGKALLRSSKNREEHAVVVREIETLLEPLVEEIDRPETPEVMQLRNLLHLETPIRARLEPGTDVLDLLAALHPTPAVAGWPRREAMDWLARHEREPRGWFTGPVGWLDGAGDGAMAVAIRSALVEARRAHAFAGAGIMHDSDPPMEYGETAVKLEAVLRALGAVPVG